MTFKNIVVHLDDGGRPAGRVDVAAGLALGFDAHLAGLYLVKRPELPRYAPRAGADILHERYREWQREQVDRMRAQFQEQTARAGVIGEFRFSDADPVDTMALHARYADLIVLGQFDPEDTQALMGGDFAERVMLECGRPVLLVPYAGRCETPGKRILVAWNASREAARAVSAALPLLRRAAKVIVMAINPANAGDHGEQPGADIALFLARHGVPVTATSHTVEDVDAGSWLLSRASDAEIDLIVMGGYGHSRIRELAFGGVTRTLMQSMTVPVLMAH